MNLLGYETVGRTAQGTQAVLLARELRPDLVLMDIKLEGEMDGIEAASSIHTEGIPVVFLSAMVDVDTVSRAKRAIPFGYIIKPFSGRELQPAIEMALHRHQIERMLARSEERMRLIFAGTQSGIWDRDFCLRSCFFAPSWWQMLGYEAEALPATPQFELELTHPEDRDRVEQTLTQQLTSSTSVYEVEFRLRHKAGHYVPVLARGLILRDA
ncbi:MAG: response regulator, partial [Opitutae bacterium]